METMMLKTMLLKLVMRGDCGGVNELLTNNIEIIGGFTFQGNSALHVAAARGHDEMVELLVTRMPSMLSMRNSNQETPLHTAARSGNCKVIEALLSCPQRRDLEAFPIDFQAIWTAQNNKGETALHYAVKGNHLDAVEQLLSRVSGIELIVNNLGESPLYTACYYGCHEIGKKLLLEGQALRDNGTSCLHEVINNILDWRNKRRQWHDFALELVFQLVRERRELADAIDPWGNSPLHLLVALPFPDDSHLKLVKELVNAGPEMNLRLNEHDMAPIHIAARDGNERVLRCLLDSAPDCSYLLDNENRNALHFALKGDGGLSLLLKVECLLEHSVDKGFLLNEPDNQGKTALIVANEAIDEPLKRLIFERMLGTSAPDPHVLKKSNDCESNQLDFNMEVAGHEAEGDQSKEGVEGKSSNERLSVIAALIATITFAAAFTIPGGFIEGKGSLVLMHKAALKIFILFDSLALCLSIMSLLQLIYNPSLGLHKRPYKLGENILGPRELRKRFGTIKNFEECLTRLGIPFLFLSLYATMVAFASGIYVVVAPKCPWLAVTVCLLAFGSLFLECSLSTVLQPIRLLPTIWLIFRDLWQDGRYSRMFQLVTDMLEITGEALR